MTDFTELVKLLTATVSLLTSLRPFQGTQAGLEAQKERPPSLRR